MNRSLSRVYLALVSAVLLAAGSATAEDTRVTVRVLAKDAKFVGTGMGGAMIRIRDLDTGEVLASGLTEGGTGDTGLIMNTAHARGQVIGGSSAASFSALLDLSAPVHAEISAEGPMGLPESANRVSLTQWLLPGKNLDAGDGIVLVLPGFALQTLSPVAGQILTAGQSVMVKVKMVMMCGCPIAPGGLWDADKIQISARLSRNGKVLGDWPMVFSGQTSQFQADLPADDPGGYEVVVTAYDGGTGNTGLHTIRYPVSAP
jgi:hypothetical protein